MGKRKEPVKLKCRYCGKSFWSRHAEQKFCSTECRLKGIGKTMEESRSASRLERPLTLREVVDIRLLHSRNQGIKRIAEAYSRPQKLIMDILDGKFDNVIIKESSKR